MTTVGPVTPSPAKPFLGRYQLQKKLAVGGMAEIYLAHASGAGGFQKQVVVKRILPQLAESEELFQMFLDEARIAATLQHANVVQVYDACEENGEYFMAMEYLDGTDLRTLRRVLADSSLPLPWEHALHIVSSIASGLHYAHEKRAIDGTPLLIVHRDVSPHNIFLTREGSVKLVDFGIAKAQGRTTETALGTLKGKLGYMAPEQCASQAVDRRCDIYSLGVILYELTAGRRLYKSDTEYELIKEIVEGEIAPPSSFMEYPEELEAVVLKCLQKNPNDRYSNAREIQADLDLFSRDYQLICSTLNFSAFIEPLLEKANRAAEERWKHRKDIAPIRVGNSGAVGTVPPPIRGAASLQAASPVQPPKPPPPPKPTPQARATSRADEIIEDFLSARHIQPQVREARPESAPLAVNTSYLRKPSPETLSTAQEDLTRPVPADMLERLRTEEQTRLEAERAEQDAVPRLARGSVSGELSVSTHVVRRDTTRSIIVGQPAPKTPLPEEVDQEPGHADVRVRFIDLDDEIDVVEVEELEAEVLADSAKPASELLTDLAKETRIATALVQPIEPDLLPLEDIRVTRKSGKLWMGLSLGAGAAIAAVLAMGASEKPAAPTPEAPKPELGGLLVQADPGAEVWLFLGPTPVDTLVIHGEETHRVRAEHEGYHAQEMLLGPKTWERDESGVQFAQANLSLSPLEDQAPGAPYVDTDLQAGERPAKIILDSTPTAANAWLFVGTTPEVQIGNLRTGEEVQLRIIHGNHPPMYRSVGADEFDAEGQAKLELALPAPLPAKIVEPEPESVEPVKAERIWRPKREKRPGALAPQTKAAPPAKPADAKLSHPTPDWAK